MVDPGRHHQANLADHLGEQMQAVRRGADVQAGKTRPGIFRGAQSGTSINNDEALQAISY
jgi:hypothetical protein